MPGWPRPFRRSRLQARVYSQRRPRQVLRAPVRNAHRSSPRKSPEPGISPAKYQADNGAYDAIFNHVAQMGATILDTPKCFLNRDGRYDVIRNEKLRTLTIVI
jgi:hypothetical protein